MGTKCTKCSKTSKSNPSKDRPIPSEIFYNPEPIILPLLSNPYQEPVNHPLNLHRSSISLEELASVVPIESKLPKKLLDFLKCKFQDNFFVVTLPTKIKICNDEFLQIQRSQNSEEDNSLVQKFHKSMQISRSLMKNSNSDQYLKSMAMNKSSKSIKRNGNSPVLSPNLKGASIINNSKAPGKSAFAQLKIEDNYSFIQDYPVDQQKKSEKLLNDSVLLEKAKNNVKFEHKLKILEELKEIKEKVLKFNYTDFELLESLGEIPNGLLFKAFEKKSKQILALKFLTFEKMENQSWEDNFELSDLIAEMIILERLKSLETNSFLQLISLYEHEEKEKYDQTQKIFICFTEYGRASLDQILENRKCYSEKEIAYILWPIITGLVKAQIKLGIAHCNITLSNIILFESEHENFYKLGGFEHAIQLAPDQSFKYFSEEAHNDNFYSPPELLNKLSAEEVAYNPFLTDVFSLGILILELMGFSRNNINELRTMNFDFSTINPDYCMNYPLLLSIVKEMLNNNPENRLSLQSAMLKFVNIDKKPPLEEPFLIQMKDKMADLFDDRALKNYEDFCRLYFDLGHWKMADNFIDLALDLIEKKSNTIEKRTTETINGLQGYKWRFLGYKAIVFRETEQLDEALKLHNHVLDMQNSFFNNEQNLEVASSYEGIGLVYKLKKDLQKAIKYLTLALDIKKQFFGEKDIIIAQLLTEIGLIYKQLGFHNKALESLNKALEVSLNILGDSNLIIATYYTNIGLCHQEQGEWALALNKFEKALTIRLEFLNEEEEIIAISYLSIAILHEDRRDLLKAIEFHQKALNIMLKINLDHKQNANSYLSLGNLYQELGELANSLQCNEKALEITIRLYGEKDERTCMCLNNIGRICHNLGKIRDALSHHQKALKIRMSLFGLNRLETSFSLLNVGIVYQDLGDYEKAKEHIETAIGVRIKLFGEHSLDTAVSYAALGGLHQEMGNYKYALEIYDKAWKIRVKILGEKNPFTAIAYADMAQCMVELGLVQKAFEYNELSYKVLKELSGERNVFTCISHSSLGYIMKKLGQLDNALGVQKTVMEWRNQLFGENNRFSTVNLNNIGEILVEMKLFEEALEYHKKSLKVRIELFGEFHPETAQSYENLAKLYGLMRNVKEEKGFRTKAEEIKNGLGICRTPIKF